MKERLKRLLPAPEALRNSRWLRWLGPSLFDPRLWHFSRRGIALGVALGVFFGLLVPLAQIPLSAGAAMLLRANVPAAVASTLVSNPVTFGPIYYAAYRLGAALVGEEAPAMEPEISPPRGEGVIAWLDYTWERFATVGKPLLLGLAIMASAMGLLVYLAVTGLWRLKTVLAWRRRRKPVPPQRDASQDG